MTVEGISLSREQGIPRFFFFFFFYIYLFIIIIFFYYTIFLGKFLLWHCYMENKHKTFTNSNIYVLYI